MKFSQILSLCLMALLLLSGAQARRALRMTDAPAMAPGPMMADGPMGGMPMMAPEMEGETYGLGGELLQEGGPEPKMMDMMMEEPMASPPMVAPGIAPMPMMM